MQDRRTVAAGGTDAFGAGSSFGAFAPAATATAAASANASGRTGRLYYVRRTARREGSYAAGGRHHFTEESTARRLHVMSVPAVQAALVGSGFVKPPLMSRAW
jgi:hypothetical protein